MYIIDITIGKRRIEEMFVNSMSQGLGQKEGVDL